MIRGYLLLIVALLVTTLRPAVAHAEDTLTLSCPERFELPGELSPAVDIRWAGDRAVFILRTEHGTSLHRLTEGLPVESLVLPGRHQQPRIHLQYMLAVSESYILASNGGENLWRKLESSDSGFDTHEQIYGGFGDVDIQGDRIAILGNTEPKDWRESPGTRAWIGQVKANKMGDFAPLLPEDSSDIRERKRVSNYIFSFAGSLRFLSNGDLFVFPGYRAKGYLFDKMGKEKRTWDLSSLGLATGKSDRLLAGDIDAGYEARVAAWGKEATTVDEVLAVGKQPAVVVKALERGRHVWKLGMLAADSIEWYRIPVAQADSSARLRGDVDKEGRFVLLVGGRRPGRDSTSSSQEVLLCELP